MKKLLFSLALCLAALPLFAQNPKSISFISDGVTTLYLTNTIGITNLNPFSLSSSNKAGLIWTNGSLNAVTVVAGSNDTINMFRDVQVWPDREGRWWTQNIIVTNSVIKSDVDYGSSAFNVNYVMNGNANFTNYINFVIVPMFDGINEATDQTWSFDTIKGNGATMISGATNVPIWRWPGVQKLRFKYMVQTNGQALSNNCAIYDLNLNGYQP